MKLGVIGGLGPMATAYYLQLVTEFTAAEKDQDHLDIDIVSRPGIPDRTEFILGLSDQDPVPGIIAAGKELISLGDSVIAIPCMTAHYFHDRIQESLEIPVINAVLETAKELKGAGAKKCAVLATDGSVRSGVFEMALSTCGIETIYPDEAGQKVIMNIIYEDVKGGNPIDIDSFNHVSENLFHEGADAIILGCTELSIVKRDFELPAGFIDCMDVLAVKAIEFCGGKVRKDKEVVRLRK